MFRIVSVSFIALSSILSACGGGKGSEPGSGSYERLPDCDTENWLGLPDSLSCPTTGPYCQKPGSGKVAVNACMVGNRVRAYSIIVGVSFASELKATLNETRIQSGPANGYLEFDDLRAKNELVLRVEYKNALLDSVYLRESRTYYFLRD